MKKLMEGFDWIAKMAHLNILWLLFTILGLGIFGFFPATVAMYTIIRRWLRGTITEWKIGLFFDIFKKEFWKSNLIGIALLLFGFLSYVNIQYMSYFHEGLHQFIKLPLLFVMAIFTVTVLYVIPVHVHYQVSFKEVFEYAFYIMLIHPLYNLGMLLSIGFLLILIMVLPNAIFFFLGSMTAYIIMRTCLHIFNRMAERQERLQLNEN